MKQSSEDGGKIIYAYRDSNSSSLAVSNDDPVATEIISSRLESAHQSLVNFKEGCTPQTRMDSKGTEL